MDARTLVATDLAALIHPLHHPADHQAPVVFVEGHGAVLRDAEGREYLDGLASLWNVNVGSSRSCLVSSMSCPPTRTGILGLGPLRWRRRSHGKGRTPWPRSSPSRSSARGA